MLNTTNEFVKNLIFNVILEYSFVFPKLWLRLVPLVPVQTYAVGCLRSAFSRSSGDRRIRWSSASVCVQVSGAFTDLWEEKGERRHIEGGLKTHFLSVRSSLAARCEAGGHIVLIYVWPRTSDSWYKSQRRPQLPLFVFFNILSDFSLFPLISLTPALFSALF